MEAGEYYAALFINNSSIRFRTRLILLLSAISNLDEVLRQGKLYPFPSPSSGKFNLLSQVSARIKLRSGSPPWPAISFLTKNLNFPGMHSEEIDLSGASSGTYLISLKTVKDCSWINW
jgi:hypothetical protein